MLKNCKGVSVLVGFILMMMILMLFLSTVQTFEVPSVCKKNEVKAMNEYLDAFSKIASGLVGGSSTEVSFSEVSYPNYLFLLTPPTASYSLNVENYTIHLSFQAILPNGSVENFNLIIPTKRINFTPGFYYYPKDKLIYENTVVFRKSGRVLIPIVQQKMISGSINVIGIIGKDKSISSNSPISLSFIPVSRGSIIAKNISISFKSVNPTYWKKFGANESGNIVSFYLNSAKLNIMVYRIEYSQNAVSGVSNAIFNGRIFLLENAHQTVNEGESLTLGVKVVNNYFQPIPGVNVSVSVSNGIGKVIPDKLRTDYAGVATINFIANAPGEGSITFHTIYGNVSYNITVKSLYTSVSEKGPFTLKWDNKSQLDSNYGAEWNATLEGRVKNLEVSVSYQDQPLSGVKVNFISTNNSVVKVYPSENVTTSGIAGVNAFAYSNGSATLIAYTAGSYDTLNLSLVGVPSIPPNWWNPEWKLRVPINITNQGSTLKDYQILVKLGRNFDWKNVSYNGADIRFADSSNNPKSLPYWIEYWDYGNEALIWVKVNEIKSGKTTIYMYFGNSKAKSESNGSATFIFFDNFTIWRGWHQLWDGIVSQYLFNGEYVLKKSEYADPNGGWKSLGNLVSISNFRMLVKEYRPNIPTNALYDRYGLTDDQNNGYFIIREAGNGWVFGIERRDGKSATVLSETRIFQPAGIWYITELTKYGSTFTAKLYQANNPSNPIARASASDSRYNTFTRFEVRGGEPYYVKWIAVAKYVFPEPISSVGNEQVITN